MGFSSWMTWGDPAPSELKGHSQNCICNDCLNAARALAEELKQVSLNKFDDTMQELKDSKSKGMLWAA